MTAEQVRAFIREQTATDEDLRVQGWLVPPRRISIIVRSGVCEDSTLVEAWLVGEEDSGGGYKIILRDDGSEFGLATAGFPSDKHAVLVGWYGDLKTTMQCM